MRKYLVVVSEEKGYAQRLCSHLDQRNCLQLTAVPFENGEDALRFCSARPAEGVLADERIITEGIFSGLTGKPVCIALTDEREPASMNTLYRYSGVDEIMRRLTEILGENTGTVIMGSKSHSLRLIAVYSPSLPSVKTAFAITLAAMEKRIRKTLYLNLEEFGGTGSLLPGKGEKTLSDAIYYLRQESLDSAKLKAMICSVGSVDYIPSMMFADDVREADGSDWVRLISRIGEISEYEEVIVDLPQALSVGQELIDACDELYIPVGGDSISEARMEELERYMERADHRHMLEKAKRVRIGGEVIPPVGYSSDYPEELMYGKFGEELIREVNAGRAG